MNLAHDVQILSTVAAFIIVVATVAIIYLEPALQRRTLLLIGLVSSAMFVCGLVLSIPSYFGMDEVTGTWRDAYPSMATYVGLAFLALTVLVGSVRHVMRAKHA